MFIKTVKIKSVWAAVTVLAVVAVAVAAAVFAVKHAQSKSEMYRMTNEVQRQEFIDSLGWEVPQEYDTCRVVIIPEKFDEVYENYNKLQKQQGFDLEEYKGKTVEIFSYPVYNYDGEKNVMMNLMVCDGMLIGGDVCSTKLDGFMHGLKKPASLAESSSQQTDGSSEDGDESLADGGTDGSSMPENTDSSSEAA